MDRVIALLQKIANDGVGGGGASTPDGDAFTAGTTAGTIAMGVYEATPTTVTDNDAAAVGIDSKRNVKTVGNVASGATDSGSPVKTGGKYNATPPTLTDGQRGDTQLDGAGNTKISMGTTIAGEDITNDRLKVEHRYTPLLVAADTQVKSGAGFLHTLTFSCNDAAPTAGSIIVYDNTAESGTQLFNHTFTTTPFMPFSVIIDGSFATGLYVGFTTTNDVNVTVSYR